MQHSARSTPLPPDAAGGSRALRPDRSAPPRRSSRHTADAEQAAPQASPVARAVEQAASAVKQTQTNTGRQRRARKLEFDSLFSLEQPPPIEAPPGITEITGWELAAAMWRDHLPDQLLGVDCGSCKQPWPCDGWKIADDLLTECCEAAGDAAAIARG